MAKKAEIATLREQVEALRAEVAALRAVPWWQQPGGGVAVGGWPAGATWPYLPASPQCSCGTSVRCMKHFPSDWSTIWVSAQNTCCAAPAPQSFVFDTAAAKPFVFELPASTFGAAGCAPVQTFMVNTGA